MLNPIRKSQKVLLSAQILWALAILLVWAGFLFFSPIDFNYTSGEILDHVMAWINHESLYAPPSDSPYRVLNYPPLFFLMVGGLSKLGLEPHTAGRLIGILAFATICTVLFRWFRQEGCRPMVAGGLTALLSSSFPILYSVGQIHIQLPAVALSLLGLFHLKNTDSLYRIILGGIFLALACFIKQTQVITVVIAGLWLLFYHRRRFLPFALTIATLGLMGSNWIYLKFGAESWRQMIHYTVGVYSLLKLFKQLLDSLLPWGFFTFLAFWIGQKYSQERKSLRWWYFLGSTLWLVSASRMGGGTPYFIEWCIATLLWIGPWLNRIYFQSPTEFFPFKKWITPLLIFQIVLNNIGVAAILTHDIKTLSHTNKMLFSICNTIAQDQNLIPGEDPGMILACGKRPAIHPFIMTSLAQQDLWDQTPFLQQLSNGTYPTLLLPFDPGVEIHPFHLERWTPQMISAINENYEIRNQYGKWRILKSITN